MKSVTPELAFEDCRKRLVELGVDKGYASRATKKFFTEGGDEAASLPVPKNKARGSELLEELAAQRALGLGDAEVRKACTLRAYRTQAACILIRFSARALRFGCITCVSVVLVPRHCWRRTSVQRLSTELSPLARRPGTIR